MSTATTTQSQTTAGGASVPHPGIKWEELAGGMQFAVYIPDAKTNSKWINDLRGVFDQKKQAYVFLMSNLAKVEEALGLQPGKSGLRDPNHFFNIRLRGDVYTAGKFEDFEKEMKAKGFVWRKQTKCFEGDLANIGEIVDAIAK
jgi:hypothetical protein